MANPELQRFRFYMAVKDVVELFAEQELGTVYEINENALLNYCNSLNFAVDMIECDNEKEAVYKKITDDILNGYPIWRLLKLSDWTMNMLEKSFSLEIQKEKEYLEKTYKCFTCKFYSNTKTSLGDIDGCNYDEIKKKEKCEKEGKRYFPSLRRHDKFNPKKKCKKYENKSEE